MRSACIRTGLALTAALSLVAFAHVPVRAQSTAFTYQGRLDDADTPAGGLHDFRFRLFDAASGGVQIGSTLCVDDVDVVAGIFTAQIDFGQQFATAAERHLEIEVRRDTGLPCADETGFILMSPRQQLTAAPVAIHANSAFSLDAADGSPASAVYVDDSGNVGLGTTAPTARLDVRGGAMLVENVGDQADLLWLASERSWVFRQHGIGSSAALKLESVGGGGNKNFVLQTDGYVGIGTTAPAGKLDVRGDIRLGTSGQYRAAGGPEGLSILRGSVRANGTVITGTGFTASRVLQGVYRITYSSAFAVAPTVVVSPRIPTSGGPRLVNTVNVSTSGFNVYAYLTNNTITDTEFDFVVLGAQ